MMIYYGTRHKRYSEYGEALIHAEREKWRRLKTASHLFLCAIEKRFNQYYGDLLTYQNKAVIDLGSILDFREDSKIEHVVLLRSVYVFPEYRGTGVLTQVLDLINRAARDTGACIVAVCNPFEHDFLPEDSQNRKKHLYHARSLYYESDYITKQKRMRSRLLDKGYVNLDISECISNTIRCTPHDTFILIPNSADANFVRSIESRLLKG